MAVEYEVVHLTDRAALHEWLAVNHETSSGIWFVSYRKREFGPRVEYDDMIEECLCYGWIDSTLRILDERRSAIRLTPRKPRSMWSRLNKERLERLFAAGLMQPAGRHVVEQAKQDGSWTLLDDVDNLVMPDDLTAALAEADASEQFVALSPSKRKQLLWWVKSAKRPATRAGRIEKVVAAAAQGRSALE